MDIDNFKQELKALLDKYNAAIYCEVDGDTHGLLYEMKVVFTVNGRWIEKKLCDGNEIDKHNIKM